MSDLPKNYRITVKLLYERGSMGAFEMPVEENKALVRRWFGEISVSKEYIRVRF